LIDYITILSPEMGFNRQNTFFTLHQMALPFCHSCSSVQKIQCDVRNI